jgi:hypothetical protein
MTKTTRIYLDVDGVINAVLSGSPDHWGETAEGDAVADGNTYPIVWAPAMVAELAALENVEIVWTTTWRDDAVRSIAPLIGLGEDFRVLHPNRDPDAPLPMAHSIEWKAAAVFAEQAEDPSPFIHIDDEINYHKWQGMIPALGGLAISPNPYYGITKKHIAMIKDYIAKQQFVEDE